MDNLNANFVKIFDVYKRLLSNLANKLGNMSLIPKKTALCCRFSNHCTHAT
jgi:hypothetical protein